MGKANRRILTNIYKRVHRSGREAWMVRWKDPRTGRWIARTAGRTEDEAVLAEARIREDIALGRSPEQVDETNGQDMTVAIAAAQFLESVKFQNADPDWQHETRRRLEQDILPELGKAKFRELKQERVFKFYLYLKKERGLSHASIQKYHSLMASLGDIYADKQGEGENPIRGLRKFKEYFPEQAPGRDINFLVPEELDAIYEKAKQSRCKELYPFIDNVEKAASLAAVKWAS